MMNSFPPLFKSTHQNPSAGVTIAITMLATVASLLFVVNFHHNSNIKLSLDLKAAATHHIRNQSSTSGNNSISLEQQLFSASNSSTPITVVSNRTYAHHVTPGYQDYQTVDENKIKIISSNNTSNGPAVFVLHIGPHKTASSVIQCDLTRYREELYKSASVAYLGRIYGHCLKKRRKNNNKHTLNPRLVINNCFKTGGCERKDVWKKLESELAYLSAHNKHVILSDEAFARMYVTSNHHQQDNRKMLFDLVNRYYPGRMRVAVVYRRYYEWQLSLWNEFNKPFENGNGDASNYKNNYRNWPSEGGKRCHTFASYLEKLLDPEKTTTRKRARTELSYRDRAEANHVHAAQYFQGLWSNHSSDVRVLNLHKMNVPSENGEDVTSRFLQSTLTPLAAETYIRSKESGFSSRHNPSRNINYDMLAVAAYEHGLLANQTSTIPRAKVAMLLETYLMKKKFKNTTITDLPLQCPNEEQLKRFLQKSLHYEKLLYPNQSNDDVAEHKMNFYEAVKKHKFCNFDFDALLEDEDVRAFFAEEIPLLYRKHLKH